MSPGDATRSRATRLLAGLFGPKLTCREASDLLLRRFDRGLRLLERAAFDRHLALCASCSAYADSYRATIELSRAAFRGPGGSVPEGVPESLLRGALVAGRHLRRTPGVAR